MPCLRPLVKAKFRSLAAAHKEGWRGSAMGHDLDALEYLVQSSSPDMRVRSLLLMASLKASISHTSKGIMANTQQH